MRCVDPTSVSREPHVLLTGVVVALAVTLAVLAAARMGAVLRLNDRLHRWLVESGVMHCKRCGPPRPLDVARLLRGW